MQGSTYWLIQQPNNLQLLLGTRSDGRLVLPVFSTKAKAHQYLAQLSALQAEVRVVELTAMELAEAMWFGNTYFGVALYAPDGDWTNEELCRDFIEDQGYAAYAD